MSLNDRIREMFGKNKDILEWVLGSPAERSAGIISMLNEDEKILLYDYCVLGQSKEDLEQKGLVPLGGNFTDRIEILKQRIIEVAPVLLHVHREQREKEKTLKQTKP